MKIHEKIKQARVFQKKTQHEIANELGIRQGHYSKYENGQLEFALPMLQKLTQILNIPLTDIIESNNDINDYETDMNFYPYICASAGYGAEVLEEKPVKFNFFQHAYKRMMQNSNKLDVITVEGDSMIPQYKSGDLLFLDPTQKYLQDGEIYVVRIGNSIRVKQVQEQGNTVLLVSHNPNYRDIVLDLNQDEYDEMGIRIIGKVKGAVTFN